MGIRVHKRLGYGLADVAEDDPRINPASALLQYDRLSVLEYRRFLDHRYRERRKSDEFVWSHDEITLRHEPRFDRMDLSDCVAGGEEYGLASVLLLCPVSLNGEWSRFDDAIDYMEETYLRPAAERQANHVQLFRHGIHPFNGSYMDARTGEPMSQEVMTWIRAASSFEAETGRGSDDSLPREELDAITKASTPFGTFDEAAGNIVPLVPGEVRDLAEYGDLFTAPDVWRQLRPMLYVYWG